MTTTANRIGERTKANANLLSILGDLVTSDGVQAMRLPLGTPGQVLTVDLTAECGLAWADAGGGGSLTFSDGVTKTLDNVTNDLVTGTQVDQVDIDSVGLVNVEGNGIRIVSNTATQLILGSGANTLIDAGGNLIASAGGNFTFDADAASNGSVILTADGTGNFTGKGGTGIGAFARLEAKGGQEFIQLSGGGSSSNRITIQADGTGTNGLVVLTGSSALNLNAGDGGVNLSTSGVGDFALTVNHDEIHTVGRNFSVTAQGSGGASISTEIGNLTLDAATADDDAVCRIMPRAGVPANTLLFQIWNGVGAGQQPFVDAGGSGAVVDAEARAAILQISNALNAWGFFADQP